ncbi:WavQ [Pseudoduganella sp. FT93W]|uniref:WavQ n=1 Tax=Duganella fentianensis TaxID=2692177 RepID=A0A845HXY5_9BURK|nr:WavQ [Duganella fentianensis]MYN46060.1 WavQ [Duganella fentianensis]
MKKFIIFSAAYNEKSGGAIVTHRLCHLLNEAGREAYLMPLFYSHEATILNIGEVAARIQMETQNLLRASFPTNPHFNTPVYRDNLHALRGNNDYIVIYPEIISGNPLGARNVVRWFLHDPGYHTGHVAYSPGELYFRHSAATKEFHMTGSRMSPHLLHLGYFPFELYNMEHVASERHGTAYMFRDGRERPIVHDLTDSIRLTRDLSHAQVAEIFKRIKTFICYDSRTLYSELAVLCGCESVVIPEDGVTEEQWRPEVETRSGIAYGFDKLPKARATAHLLLPFMQAKQEESRLSMEGMLRETDAFFPD